MKGISILGSTGSIGRNVLAVAEMFPENFCVKALAAKNNIALLAEQIERFKPDLAVVFDEAHARLLQQRLSADMTTEILFGDAGYQEAVKQKDVELVVSAMVGAAGLTPTLDAIRAGKQIALANKETLVMAGEIVLKTARQHDVAILPVDSEHSAIFQCLAGQRRADLSKILLTASGGPFLERAPSDFAAITPKDALNHPNWEMGQKITIDSATLMNKGLEVIEAKHLFDVDLDQIEVVIHPQSIVHSMVAYHDGSVIAQLGVPDMKGAIAYAMSYPQRLPLNQPLPDWANIGALTFKQPDFEKFSCLKLAFEACRSGGTYPAVLNAANEIAVDAFLNGRIAFVEIPKIIASVLTKHSQISEPALNDIQAADAEARIISEELIGTN